MALNAGISLTKFWCGIDGVAGGYLNSFTPPNMKVDAIKNAAGPDGVTFMAHGNLSYTDWKCTFAFSHTGPLYTIMESLINKNAVEFQARIDVGDQNYKSKRAVDCVDNVVKEISFSNLDAKDGKGLFEVTMTALCATAKYLPGDNKVGQAASTGVAKRVLKSNFRWTCPGGLKPESITKGELAKFTAKIGMESHGVTREPTLHYAAYEISQPKTTHSYTDYPGVLAYVQKCIQDGNIDFKDYAPMAVTLLNHNMSKELATFEYDGCAPMEFNWADGELKAGGDAMATSTLTWSIEKAVLKLQDGKEA
jgi:hypothetical protein